MPVISFDIEVFIQLVNTIILFGILYFVFCAIFKLPKKIKSMSQRISNIEEDLKNIKDKLN
ncbi:hypothetical protein [Tepidibacter sp. Z1-5]|uniref:hypothetical protein n=1 Tax=Tepidibacter sp. Z1-5 TaxID=3134138 RepID=UPI0030BA3946